MPARRASSFSEMDADLVELFLEEAQDILQFLESTVQRWEDAPDHENVIAELHRSLHTLKGGARLAGFDAIGTLCHVLEGIVPRSPITRSRPTTPSSTCCTPRSTASPPW